MIVVTTWTPPTARTPSRLIHVTSQTIPTVTSGASPGTLSTAGTSRVR